ncbi:hypothetical protein BDQ12DRAFT_51707 [Crucibulum laeve]|uniref:Uncharacterized protein n=1 Tax=Crucibulum laeve TaxID=68775 RepID=A0A5C3M1S5_9AGAR|nr:hypothetical protein BDQ12DRAFT_51707 [Crucibulum laeve]
MLMTSSSEDRRHDSGHRRSERKKNPYDILVMPWKEIHLFLIPCEDSLSQDHCGVHGRGSSTQGKRGWTDHLLRDGLSDLFDIPGYVRGYLQNHEACTATHQGKDVEPRLPKAFKSEVQCETQHQQIELSKNTSQCCGEERHLRSGLPRLSIHGQHQAL